MLRLRKLSGPHTWDLSPQMLRAFQDIVCIWCQLYSCHRPPWHWHAVKGQEMEEKYPFPWDLNDISHKSRCLGLQVTSARSQLTDGSMCFTFNEFLCLGHTGLSETQGPEQRLPLPWAKVVRIQLEFTWYIWLLATFIHLRIWIFIHCFIHCF